MLKGKVNKQTNKKLIKPICRVKKKQTKKNQLLQCKSRMSSKMPVSVFSCQ